MGKDLENKIKMFASLPTEAGVSYKVAAAVLGVSTPTIWRWAAEGKMTRVKIGVKTTRFNVGEIREMLKG